MTTNRNSLSYSGDYESKHPLPNLPDESDGPEFVWPHAERCACTICFSENAGIWKSINYFGEEKEMIGMREFMVCSLINDGNPSFMHYLPNEIPNHMSLPNYRTIQIFWKTFMVQAYSDSLNGK